MRRMQELRDEIARLRAQVARREMYIAELARYLSVEEVFEAGKKHGAWRWSRGGFELVFNDDPLTRREVAPDEGTHYVDDAANDTPGSQTKPCDTKSRKSITGEDVMPLVGGRVFACHCGCRVFRREGILYTCKSCGSEYEGTASETEEE